MKPLLFPILITILLFSAGKHPATAAEGETRQVIALLHGVSWGALEAADPQSGGIHRQIVIADTEGKIYWMITLVPETGCLWTHLIINSPKPLDFGNSPTFSVDGQAAVEISAWRSTGYDKNAWIWAMADCDPAEAQKIVAQFKKGDTLRLRYFLQSEGATDINLPLKGFTRAYRWLEGDR